MIVGGRVTPPPAEVPYQILVRPERPPMNYFPACDRRDFLRTSAGAVAFGIAARRTPAAEPRQIKVAAVVTEFTYRSHAHCILENFLEPYYFNGKATDSPCEIVSLYA